MAADASSVASYGKTVNFTIASSGCSESRIMRQNQSIVPSRSVCRNLFGPVDHDEFRQELRKQNIERLEEKKLQYNFDFEKHEPLQGSYLWEKVSNLNRTENINKLRTEDRLMSKNRSPKVLSKTDSPQSKSSKDQGEHKITGELYICRFIRSQ